MEKPNVKPVKGLGICDNAMIRLGCKDMRAAEAQIGFLEVASPASKSSE